MAKRTTSTNSSGIRQRTHERVDRIMDKAERVRGPDGRLTPECGYEDALEALVGTRDIALLNQLSQWLHGLNTYLSRVNTTPTSETQRALVLGVSLDRFSIGADGIILNRPARGVVLEKILPSATGVLR